MQCRPLTPQFSVPIDASLFYNTQKLSCQILLIYLSSNLCVNMVPAPRLFSAQIFQNSPWSWSTRYEYLRSEETHKLVKAISTFIHTVTGNVASGWMSKCRNGFGMNSVNRVRRRSYPTSYPQATEVVSIYQAIFLSIDSSMYLHQDSILFLIQIWRYTMESRKADEKADSVRKSEERSWNSFHWLPDSLSNRLIDWLTWTYASRHSGVQLFNISTSKSGPNMQCFVHFHLKLCFSPQRRAIFQHLNFKKWSETSVF